MKTIWSHVQVIPTIQPMAYIDLQGYHPTPTHCIEGVFNRILLSAVDSILNSVIGTQASCMHTKYNAYLHW